MKPTLTSTDHAEIWAKCLDVIRDNVNTHSFKTWFEPIRSISLEGQDLTIQVPTQFYYEWLEEHYVELLKKSVRLHLGPEARLHYSILMESESNGHAPRTVQMPTQHQEYGSRPQTVPMPMPGSHRQIPNPFILPGLKKASIDPQLNPYYNFESLIEGECNRLARTAGLAVAASPGQTAFNPLFIYGGVGMGKTHLMMAIGNEVRRKHPDKVVLYISSEKFVNQFVDAVKNSSIGEFISFYQMIDVLLVDDIQFMASKERSQDIFFHVFNHLHQLNKQIILSSDCAAGDLKGMEERLISRFKWGLSADLHQPDLETRLAILKFKMVRDGLRITDEVLQYLAHNISTNIRELEGALISLVAQSSFNHKEIDLELARTIVKNFVRNSSRELSIESIQKIVCDYFKIPVERLKEKTRKREIVQARQISMHFAKQYTKHSLKSIGLYFGGRDHSTVIHAIHTVNDLVETDRDFRRWVEDIKKKIQLCNS